MKQIRFTPSIDQVGSIKADEETIKDEPMLYGASIDMVLKNADRYPLTYKVFKKITKDPKYTKIMLEQAMMGYHPVIDTKSVLLMKGQYPCIPGWHCDGVIRRNRNSQPDLSTLNEPVMHYICTITATGHVPTLVVKEPVTLEVDETKVWQSVDREVNQLPLDRTTLLDNGGIYRFNRSTIHKGVSACERTWRYFFRMSYYHMPCANEERKQVQVYTIPSIGW